MAVPIEGTTAAQAHIAAQTRLQDSIAVALTRVWENLGGYDEEDVAPWLAIAVPLVIAAQRAAVTLTDAFVASVVGRRPIGVDANHLIAGLRGDITPETVYRRPFVTAWTDLSNGTAWETAVDHGLTRATSSAQTDVQMAMRQTLAHIAERDRTILGYRRVPDPGACSFCRLVAGQRYTRGDLMPIHSRCKCGVDVITRDNRHEFSGNPKNDLATEPDVKVAVRTHGELGPVLGDARHAFTTSADLGL